MSARLTAVVAVAFFALPVLADDKDKGAGKEKDQETLQGTWKIEKAVRGGMEMPAEMRDKVTLEFKGNEVIVHEENRDEPAEFTIDPTKSPRTINIKPKKGNNKEVQGIYELKGDTLKICFAREGGDRPTKFESPKESNLMLMELKRVNK